MTASRELLILLALLLALGTWRGLHRRETRPWPTRLAESLLPAMLGGIAFFYWETAALSTRWIWSACRLAPTIGLFHGYPLYSPEGSGPINGWLYGPVAALAWSPAALAGSPLPALLIATVINLLFLLIPLLAAGCRQPHRPDLAGALAFVFGAAALLQIYPTWYMASSLNADAIAVGLGTASCLVLLHAQPDSGKLRWLAAFLGVLSFWTKQTEALLLVGQAAWLWWVHGRSTALRYAVAYTAAMATVTALVFVCFNPRDVLFNLWTVPSGHALAGGWQAALTETKDFVRYSLLLWLPCLLVPLVGSRRSLASPPNVTPASKAVLLFIAVALVALPLGIMAAIKVGGDRNSMHSVYYLAIAATLTLGRLWPVAAARPKGLMAGALVLAVLCVTFLTGKQVLGYPAMTVLPQRCLSQEAWSYARSHPGQVYFPWDPLATLMAGERFYHFEYGVLDRIYAHRAPDKARLAENLPVNPEVVIYPRADYPRTMIKEYLTDYSFSAATADWLIHRRTPPK
jgi:hypothetical protein